MGPIKILFPIMLCCISNFEKDSPSPKNLQSTERSIYVYKFSWDWACNTVQKEKWWQKQLFSLK